jgi:hypothetical protein
MNKRLEWINSVPEAMNKAQLETNLMRMNLRLAVMPRGHIECKIQTARRWLAWFESTDFSGRYVTNQVLFVQRVLPMMEDRLIQMGDKRPYIKTKNYVKSNRKR